MDKKVIVALSIHYPLTMARYFEHAFRLRDDVEYITVGPYTGTWIPWMGGIHLNSQYANPPDIVFPQHVPSSFPYELVAAELGKRCIVPDAVLNIDAGIHWAKRPNVKCPVVHIATDPHCLDYSVPRTYSDYFFNMQSAYMCHGDLHLPYAFDDTWCYKEQAEKRFDAVLVGMPYVNRINLINELRRCGLTVAFENGPVFDEYRKINNSATVGLNYSSLNDLTCRVFEIMGMGLVPVINNVPELSSHFVNGEHYLGFDTQSEAVEYVLDAVKNEKKYDNLRVAAMELVHSAHTYRHRVQQIMESVFYAN